MEWLTTPVLQLGAVGVLLAVSATVLRMVFTGTLVPKSLVTREDAVAMIAQAEKDRDERVAEACADAEKWQRLFEQERAAHETTRQAHAEDIRSALLASTEGAQMAAALLTELKQRQIEGRHDA